MAQQVVNGKVRTVKTHLFITAGNGDGQGYTACGIKCWESKFTASEAETVPGNRLEITTKPHLVDCEKCAAQATRNDCDGPAREQGFI